jgi:hypothetical protein
MNYDSILLEWLRNDPSESPLCIFGDTKITYVNHLCVTLFMHIF